MPRHISVALLFAVMTVSGCITGEEVGGADPGLLDATTPPVYAYRWTGDDVGTPGYPVGGAFRVTNVWDAPVMFSVTKESSGFVSYTTQHVNRFRDSTDPVTNSHEDNLTNVTEARRWTAPGASTLDVGETALYLWSYTMGANTTQDAFVKISIDLFPGDLGPTWDPRVLDQEPLALFTQRINYQVDPGRAAVRPGDHVDTLTVGLWTNGTSFYTNIADLNADEAFPAGYPATDFDATPLPVYVYDRANSEQPIGSRDTCHFTTIEGYNDLLKTQAELGTNVRYLQPEEAYTLEGREDFFLYGEPLIFINTIVKHHAGTAETDEAPDPQGDCHDYRNVARKSPVPSPVPLPPVPPS